LAFAFLVATAGAVTGIPHVPPRDTLAGEMPKHAPIPGPVYSFTKAAAPNGITKDANPIPPGGFADLTIDVPKSASVVWRISPAPVQRATGLMSGRLIFGGKQGTTYTVTAIVVDFDAKTVVDTDTTVEFGGDVIPDPKPKPDPKPDPKPEPPDGKVTHFVVVEDTTAAASWRGDILGSSKVAAFYQQLQGGRSGPIHALIDVKAGLSDQVAKRFLPLAQGKKLPYLWMLDGVPETGKVLKELPAPIDSPDSFIAAFDLHTAPRKMGLIIAAPKLKWNNFGESPNVPLIDRGGWKDTRLASFLPGVYDQDGVGQCASSAACTLAEMAAKIQGITYPKLSAGDLYGRRAVNGGSDNGSLLEDNLKELIDNGVAPASMVPYVWDRKMTRSAAVIEERKKYRILEAYWCPSFEAAASAIQQGFVVEVGLMWPNAEPGADGWLPNVRTSGGHALCAYGLVSKQVNGKTVWGLLVRNSWGPSWGMAGDCIIPESLFGGNIGGFYAARVVTPKVALRTNPLRVRESEYALAP